MKRAEAVLSKGRDVWEWKVLACPQCGKRHTHGGGPLDGDPRQFLGPRSPHCGDIGQAMNEEYTLVEHSSPPWVHAKGDNRAYYWSVDHSVPFVVVNRRRSRIHTSVKWDWISFLDDAAFHRHARAPMERMIEDFLARGKADWCGRCWVGIGPYVGSAWLHPGPALRLEKLLVQTVETILEQVRHAQRLRVVDGGKR
jgi:hypothetical protein